MFVTAYTVHRGQHPRKRKKLSERFGYMNFNEDYRTPRDRVSSEMRSQSRNSCGCGENSEHSTRESSCGCARSTENSARNSSCGCSRSTENTTHNSNCGCERNSERTTRNNSCGCVRSTENTTHNSNCGCERSSERTTRNSTCGCERNSRSSENSTCNSCSTNRSGNVSRSTRNCPNTVCTTIPVEEGCVDEYPIAMAYVPMQQWRELYDPMSGISHGTIFRELDLPWYPTNCGKNGNNCRR